MMNELNYGSGCTVPLGLDCMSQLSFFFFHLGAKEVFETSQTVWLTAMVVHVNLHCLYQLQLPLALTKH